MAEARYLIGDVYDRREERGFGCGTRRHVLGGAAMTLYGCGHCSKMGTRAEINTHYEAGCKAQALGEALAALRVENLRLRGEQERQP